MKNGKLNKVFEWIAPKNYKFTGNESPDFSSFEKDDSLTKMKTFTIMMQFSVDEDNGQAELFGHSECDCWGLLFTSQGLRFGPKCKDNMINLGFQIA